MCTALNEIAPLQNHYEQPLALLTLGVAGQIELLLNPEPQKRQLARECSANFGFHAPSHPEGKCAQKKNTFRTSSHECRILAQITEWEHTICGGK